MVKLFAYWLVLGLCIAHPLLEQGYTLQETALGNKYTKQLSPTSLHSVIEKSSPDELSYRFIERLNERLKGEVLSASTITCQWGEGPDFFRIVPEWKASAQIGTSSSFSSHCFQDVTVTVSSMTTNSVTVTLESREPSSLFCYDAYIIATLNSVHLEFAVLQGTHTIEFRDLSPAEVFDVDTYGVRVFSFCDGLFTWLEDLFMSLELFLGGFTTFPDLPVFGSHTTEYMEKANIEFLQRGLGYTMSPRKAGRVDLPENEIHSGDFLAITRLDGLDEIIMLGTGGHVGHSTMALWVEGELYVVESQAGWYWPREGLQINKFSQWMDWAENASFSVVVLPLTAEARAKFDAKAAYEWFKTVEGMPYGYHNFLFGWMDTARDNFPPIAAPEIFTIVFRAAEQLMPSAIARVFGEAMNKRLGTEGLQIPELEVEAGKQGMSLLEVMALPEKDDWWYSDGYSYVCSSFVLALYKHAGLFGDMELQGTEFTPKDVYSLNIFDREYQRPQICIDNDPEIPYCQILGKYRIELGPWYGTIEPYEHMNERCPSVAPEFLRPDRC